jgi:hypothetical protein
MLHGPETAGKTGTDSRRETSMRRKVIAFCLLSLLVWGGARLGAAPRISDFSGTWTLDKSKTSNLPPQLESYHMRINQSAHQLTVKTEIAGDFQRALTPDENAPQRPQSRRRGDGYPGGGMGIPGVGFPRRRGMGYPGGPGGRYPGGNRGGYPRGNRRRGGMALRMGPPDATYSLDGHSTNVALQHPFTGNASVKTAWKKGGKLLEFITLRDLTERDEIINSTEGWQLSKDGSVLKVRRSVKTPQGTEKVKLIFNKTGSAGGI